MIPLVKPDGPQDAQIMILGDNPSESDKYEQLPFSGGSGYELSKMLQEAGILRTASRLSMVYPYRPDDMTMICRAKKTRTPDHVFYNGQFIHKSILPEIELLKEDIRKTKPNVIIVTGDLALLVLTGKMSTEKWRGSCLSTLPEIGHDCKVIPTYSPARVTAEWCKRPIMVRDLKRAKDESASPTYPRVERNFTVRPTYQAVLLRLDAIFKSLLQGPTKLSVDIETRAGYVACVGIAWSKSDAICIPFMTRTNPEGYFNLDEEAEISWKLYRVLTHSNARVVGQNFIYDIQYFWRHMFFLPNLTQDTMLSQHTCFSTMPKGLDYLASMYAAHYVYWKDEGKEWKPNDKSTEEEFWSYNCEDSVYTYEVADALEKVVAGLGLQKPHEFQQAMFWPVLKTMNRGILIDDKLRTELFAQMKKEMAEIQSYVESLIGHKVNLRSPAQLMKLFYKDLNVPPVMDRKTKRPSTSDAALTKVAEREPILRVMIEKILKFRSLGVFTSNFLSAKVGADGRIRTSYNIAGTWTFRFNSREDAFGEGTNLQNLPEIVKPMFLADPGMTFFDMDLDSADLRIVVAESGEEKMAEWLDNGLKPYVEVMKEYYHDQSLTKNDPQYKIFKALCHGTHYLGQPNGLASQTGLQVTEVERIQIWYFKKFPKIKQWQERFVSRLHSRRQFQNIFGYKFFVLDRVGGTVPNECIAALPQSTVALIINHAYLNIHNNCPNIEILLQTHDSLSGQFPTALKDECFAQLKHESQIILPYPKPIIIPTGFKFSNESYGACK
jgi:uracil-DNA glycosylase family 4